MTLTSEFPEIPRDFGFGDEHDLLRQQARRFLDERSPAAEVRRLAEDALGFDPAVWKDMAGLGWTGLVLPEAHGGAGLGALHLALLLDEMGRRLLPSPFLATVLAGLALERAGGGEQRERWCPAIASGETIATLAFCEPDGAWQPDRVAATATAAAGGWILEGAKAFALAAPSAGLVIAPFRTPDGVALFAVELPAAGVTVAAEIGVDPTRRTGRIRFEQTRVGSIARLPGDGAVALREVYVWGWMALAAEMAGAADAALVMTRDYAAQRIQFGKPIGAFQAVKHPLVDALVGVESTRTLALGAAAALDHDPERAEVAARMAKAAAGDVFSFVARKAIQLHGGYGFTWDCDAHFHFKRALWSRATLGDSLHHRRRLADALLGPAHE
jgi:alkylation response protein AidB-like acyl-CoA dehydrogenase